MKILSDNSEGIFYEENIKAIRLKNPMECSKIKAINYPFSERACHFETAHQ